MPVNTDRALSPKKLQNTLVQEYKIQQQIINSAYNDQQSEQQKQESIQNILINVQQYNDYLATIIQQNVNYMQYLINTQLNQKQNEDQNNIPTIQEKDDKSTPVQILQSIPNRKKSQIQLNKLQLQNLYSKIVVNLKNLKNLQKLIFGLHIDRCENIISASLYFVTSEYYKNMPSLNQGFYRQLNFQLARELIQLILSAPNEYQRYLLYKSLEKCIYKSYAWLRDNFYIKDSEWVMEFVDRLKIYLSGGNIECIDDLLSITFLGQTDNADRLITMNTSLPTIMKSIFNQIILNKYMDIIYHEKGQFTFVQEAGSNKQFNLKAQNNILQPDCVYDFYIQTSEKSYVFDNRVRHMCVINTHFTREISYFTKIKLNYTRHIKSITLMQCTWPNLSACQLVESLILTSVSNINLNDVLQMTLLKNLVLSCVSLDNQRNMCQDVQILLRELQNLQTVALDDTYLPPQFTLNFPMKELRMLRLLSGSLEQYQSSKHDDAPLQFYINAELAFLNNLEALFVRNRRLDVIGKKYMLPELSFIECANKASMSRHFRIKTLKISQSNETNPQKKVDGNKLLQNTAKKSSSAKLNVVQSHPDASQRQELQPEVNIAQKDIEAPESKPGPGNNSKPIISWPLRPGAQKSKEIQPSRLCKSTNASIIFSGAQGINDMQVNENLSQSLTKEQNYPK